jgi:hypothetical protein
LDFAAGSQGGPLGYLASLSPTAVLLESERGWFALPQISQTTVLALSFVGLAIAWLQSGVSIKAKSLKSVVVLVLGALLFTLAAKARFYADVTVDRRNSFNPADEAALRQMKDPLNITIYLSPDDSRLREMETNVLAKLRRIMPNINVRYAEVTNVGPFGAPDDDRYGLLTFEYRGSRDESRSNSFREILPILHSLAGVTVKPVETPPFVGHPLVADTTLAAWWFYGILPAIIVGCWFKGIAGRIDQAAGIIFNVKPNGDYLILRANCLENNLVLFKYEHGKRSQIKWIRDTPTPSRQWHDLKLEVAGKHIKGYLDGKPDIDYELPGPVSGKIGVWSKADSVVYFDDYRVVKSSP